VRLVGIQTLKLPLGREGFVAWPLAEEAKSALEAMALGRSVELFYGGLEIDRHSRALAHLVRDDGLWVQGELLKRGWARVYGFRDNRAKLPNMLALEAEAREAKRGIWAEPFYKVLTIEETQSHLGSFQLVAGHVLDVAMAKGRGYLNFGPDWRTDSTISIAPADLRVFEAEGVDIEAFEGHFV
jgi:micrococcal nuclease